MHLFQTQSLGIQDVATNETVTLGGTVSTLTRELDSLKRLQGLALDGQPLAAYTYDTENRLSTVSNAAFVAEYAYTSDGWDAGYGIALTNGVTLSRDLTRDPYRRNLINAITNRVNGTATAPLVYDYDKLNRVTSRNDDTFGYNARSEVTAASVHSNAFTYAYDHIGNHTTSSVYSDTTTYTANALNQYTQVSVPSVPSVDNLIYDLDGNLLTNGVWSYAYDAENRLTAAYSNNVCVISNAYDHMSRRVLKWTPCHTTTFVYDGWNLIQETISTASGTTTNHYVWGRDLSGTLQGAGGVGGLLAVSLNGSWYFPIFDANGNITAYVNEQGVIVAEYVYDAFGATIAASGSMSDTFRHRFSTKYYDTETGLYYYGYRFYNPVMHRWLNRDPIEEEGGLNFYLFCGNDGMNSMDFLGEFRALSGLYFETTHVIDPVSGRAKEEKIDPSQPYTGMFRHRVYEIIQLLSELSKQRDDKGNRLFTVTVKDFATADLTAMKEDVKSNRDHVYFIGHGGIVDKTSKSTIPVGVRYDWTRRNNRKTIEAFFPTGYTDRVITLDELGNPHDSNVFGCFISSRVRRQKGDLPFQPRWSTRDDYKMMFSALLGRLSRYKTSDARFESECPTRIIIYEGEIEGARESSTFIFDSLKLFD